ncbi:MAG: hypothetical protein ACI4M3_08860, partial [Acutalibacteraceae bacterium]
GLSILDMDIFVHILSSRYLLMSGPKTSHYTLTREQRRILEEQRRIRIEREMLAKHIGDARSVIVESDRIIGQMEPLYAEIGADTTTLTQAKTLHEAAVIALAQASSASDKDGSAQLQEINQNLRAAIRKLTSITKAVTTEYASADKAFRTELADRIDGGFDFTFDTIGDTSGVSSSPFTKNIQSELDDLAALSLTDDQKARVEAIQAKFAEIEDPDFLKNFYAMTVVPFAKECRAYHAAYAAQGEEYERKCFIYESNAKKLGIAAEYVPFSSDAIAVLDDRIKETEDAIRHQDEQAYISRCVDEAMREMGYSVVGDREVVRRNGKRFRNELYLFDEGTAVNVTYSSDGQITMELGGIGTDDRIPTEAESASLVSDMCTFCGDYYEIERRLRKKGIITKRISILPPDAQYAQIINVSDYNMNTDVAEYEAKSAKKHTAKSNTQRIGE